MLDALRIVNSLFLTLNVSFFHTLLDWSLVLPFYSCFSLSDLIDRCNLSS